MFWGDDSCYGVMHLLHHENTHGGVQTHIAILAFVHTSWLLAPLIPDAWCPSAFSPSTLNLHINSVQNGM
jgi:hypothetical protein